MESLVEENARLRQEVAELKAANERLERRVQELQRALEEAQRAGKRQAAPFSRRRPKAHPAKPGRKAGARYGRRCRRPIPQQVEQSLEAELPGCCPLCRVGGYAERTTGAIAIGAAAPKWQSVPVASVLIWGQRSARHSLGALQAIQESQ